MTGTDYESLAAIFLPYGPIQSIHLIPGKSFSFLSFFSESSAVSAVRSLHGVQRSNQLNGEDPPAPVLYLAYVSEIPTGLEENNPWKNAGPTPKGI